MNSLCSFQRDLTRLAERPKEYIVVTVAGCGDGEGEGFVAGPPVAGCLVELRDRVAVLARAVALLRRGRRARRKAGCRAVALDAVAVVTWKLQEAYLRHVRYSEMSNLCRICV